MTHLRRWSLAVLCFALACENGGSDRSLGVEATGVLRGSVFFDANGSGTFDAGDAPFSGARVALLSSVGADTLAQATSDADGVLSIEQLPVGSYRLVLVMESVGDSLEATGPTAQTVTLLPADSIVLRVGVRFPLRDIAQVRAGAVGTRVFVHATALHRPGAFSDTVLHVVDTTGALRATRVRPSTAVAGDSLRLLGRIALRDGQPVLDDVRVIVLGSALIPSLATLSTVAAAAADAGTRDAQLVRVLDAAIVDTATVAGSLQLQVDDGSGALTVLLDRVADAAFRPPFAPGAWDAGRQFDLIGVLVPTGGGAWVLRPRSALDLLPR